MLVGYSCDVLPFDAFELFSEEDVRKLIMNSQKKSSHLDPVLY